MEKKALYEEGRIGDPEVEKSWKTRERHSHVIHFCWSRSMALAIACELWNDTLGVIQLPRLHSFIDGVCIKGLDP